MIPFALILIPLFLSFFIGFTTLLVGSYLKLNFPSLLIFSASLAFSDYLRAYIFSGFPWNLWAYSLVSYNEILQTVNKIGLFSFNLFVITIFTLPIIIFFEISKIKKLFSIFLTISFLLGVYIYGDYVNNKNNKILKDDIEKKYFKVISPNFDLEYNLNSREIEERFMKLIRFSDPNQKNGIYLA